MTAIYNKLGGDALGLYMANSVHKHFIQSMPMNTGNFSQNITFNAWSYTHNADYSQDVYYTNKNYRKDLHIAATSEYIENYSPIAMPNVIQDYENYVKTVILS